MTSRLLIIFTLITFNSWGQKVRLETSNPAPRVDDAISISFSLEKNNLDSIEVSSDPIDKLLFQSMNRVGDGQIEISEWFLTDTGKLTIGPLQIPIVSFPVLVQSKSRIHFHWKKPVQINLAATGFYSYCLLISKYFSLVDSFERRIAEHHVMIYKVWKKSHTRNLFST